MDHEKIETLWSRFRDNLGGDLNKLKDGEVARLARHYMVDGIKQMPSKERAWLFMTEFNARSASKTALTGTILAAIAVATSVVQILLAIYKA